MADHQGSIVLAFDRTWTQRRLNTYDEWGIPGGDLGVTQGGRFRYTGQAWIPELGMYHYKARIYSPTLGRFLQTDPIGYEDQVNLYAYVGNDPVNGRDPTGLDACPPPNENDICVTGTRYSKPEPKPDDSLKLGVISTPSGPAEPQKTERYVSAAERRLSKECKAALAEGGAILTGAANANAVVGGGPVGSLGAFRNLATGTTGYFWSLGGGGGWDVGVSGTGGRYNSLASMVGYATTGSATVGICTGSASFDKNRNFIGFEVGLTTPGWGGNINGASTQIFGCRLEGGE